MRTVTFVVQFDSDRIGDYKATIESMHGAKLISVHEGNEPARVRAMRRAVDKLKAFHCPYEESDEDRFLHLLDVPIFETLEPSTKEN